MTLLAIAHRAGNDLAALRTAVELGVDVLEADVHVRAGRLEVRHSKHLRPLPVLWDRGAAGLELTRTSVPQLELDAVLAALDGSTAVMLDLKGPGRVGARVAELVHAAAPAAPVIACSRWWPGLEPFAALPWVRPVLTARTPLELRRLRRRLAGGPRRTASACTARCSRPRWSPSCASGRGRHDLGRERPRGRWRRSSTSG